MRFIKDLIAWKQQAASEIEDIRPLTRRPDIGPLIPPRAKADEDEDYDDEDYDGEDAAHDDALDDEDYEDDLADDEDVAADMTSTPVGTAASLALQPPARTAQEGDTYDLLSRVARNATPVEKPEAPPAPSAPAAAAAVARQVALPATPRVAAADPVPQPIVPQPVAPQPIAAQPATPQPAVAPPASRPARIWDIAPGTPPRRPEAATPAEPTRLEPAVPAAAAPSSTRPKTRLLGFHHPGMDSADPMGAPVARPRDAVNFPTGWLVVVEGPGRGACFTLAEGVNQIGRGDDQAVRLDFGDTSISRSNHASLAFDPESGKFFLGHGGKSNIVRLNGRPVLSTEELSGNDTIKIGETVMRFVGFCDRNFSWDDRKAGIADAQAG
jgi:hypothetical protein